ncbi:MAG: HEAT repeat domain-containing protein [Nitrospirota bacterium]
MTIGTKKLSKLLKGLAHNDSSKRRSSAEDLSSGDERAIYPLIKALKDDNPGVQDAAMRSLISIGGEVTAYMAIPLLRDEPLLRNTAMIILKEIGSASIPLLYFLLKDKDEDIRKFAIDLICEIKECNYPEEIARILVSDPNPNVRASAAKAIGILRYKDALPQLIGALRDEEWVCFSALESLALLKDESSIEPIVSLLNSPYDIIRYAAIDTLGRIASLHSSNALFRHLQKSEGFEKTATIKSLVQIGITPAMPEISDVLIDMFRNGDWYERLMILKGIVGLREEKAIYTIIDIAGSLDPSEPDAEEKLQIIKDALKNFGCSNSLIDILNNTTIKYRGKQIAIELLGDLRCKKAVPNLIRLLDSKFRDVRRAAINAIGEINDEDTTQTLLDAIYDYDGHVRKATVSALGKIGDKASVQSLLKLLYIERYRDVIEEAVNALLNIDPAALFLHLDELSGYVKEVIGKYAKDINILLTFSEDKDLKIKVSAIAGLGKIHDERAYKRLAKAMHDDEPEVRRAAVKAMGELNCCHDEIKSILNDKDMWVRLSAVKALGNSLRQDMINALKPMLYDKEVPVVLSTIDAVARLGGKKALSILNPLLNHSDSRIREMVHQVIDNIRHSENAEVGTEKLLKET